MKAIAKVRDWHRYVYAVLAALMVVLVAIQSGEIALPKEWSAAPLIVMIALYFLKDFLPRIQTSTGEGAPPILSPPPKDSGGTIQGLRDGHAISFQKPPPPLP